MRNNFSVGLYNKTHDSGPMVVLWGGVVSYERGDPVFPIRIVDDFASNVTSAAGLSGQVVGLPFVVRIVRCGETCVLQHLGRRASPVGSAVIEVPIP